MLVNVLHLLISNELKQVTIVTRNLNVFAIMSRKIYNHMIDVSYMNIAHKIKSFQKKKQKPNNNGKNKRVIY